MCCLRKLFECNVSKFTTELQTQIETKKPGISRRAIQLIDELPITVKVNDTEESYICIACKKPKKAGKLPPMSALNGLKIYKHEPEMKLTDLEGN